MTGTFYVAPCPQVVGVDFYVNSGQVATGGGWVNDCGWRKLRPTSKSTRYGKAV